MLITYYYIVLENLDTSSFPGLIIAFTESTISKLLYAMYNLYFKDQYYYKIK